MSGKFNPKRYFIIFSMAYWLALVLHGLYYWVITGAMDYGVLASGIVPLGFFGYHLLTRNTPRTSPHLYVITVVLVGAIAWSWLLVYQFGLVNVLINAGSLFIWLVYLYWYSRFPRTGPALLDTGRKLPALSFVGPDGKEYRTDRSAGKYRLLLFYRGNWCPFCVAQVRELAMQYRELEELGVELLFISPQPHDKTRKLADSLGINARFLRDIQNAMARKLGLIDNGGVPLGFELLGYEPDTVRPAVILTDENGIILYSYLSDNYRIRPEPHTFIEMIGKKKQGNKKARK